jgi:adenylylsulfate kinase
MNNGLTIWLTGYSGSGKTTIANALQERLTVNTIASEILDGDIIRQHLSKGLGFSKEDRCENTRRIGFVAELLSKNGICVIVSAISPYTSARDEVRNRISNFVEVYIKCSLEECERRDCKGLYKKARSGEILHFTGISDPYEEPVNPEIICDTENHGITESVDMVWEGLRRLGYV